MPNKEFQNGEQLFGLLEVEIEDFYIFMIDMEEDLARWSVNAVKDFGFSGPYIHGSFSLWQEIIHPEDSDIFKEDYDGIMSGAADVLDCEYRARTKAGVYIWLRSRGRVLRREDGTPFFFTGCLTNLGLNGKFDPVTNLMNMQSFKRDLLNVALQRNGTTAVMAIDINNFSHFNEKYTYNFGNRILKVFAEMLMKEKPSSAVCYRMDSDKFALIYPGGSREELKQLFQKVRDKAHMGCYIAGRYMTFSITGGALYYPEDGKDPELIHRNLECALAYSKKRGRKELQFYTQGIMEKALRELELIEELQKCIRHGLKGFTLVYQPIIDNGCKKLSGCEALLRFKSPAFGLISPDEFIPLLEKNGGITEVGYWVAETALKQLKKWQTFNPELYMNINVSYIQFQDEKFTEKIEGIIEKYKIVPSTVILELTESCRTGDLESLSGNIEYFHKQGVKIALDDFGTGYASISILRQVNTDWVKVDHHFVSQIVDRQSDRDILEYIIGLCRKLNIVVCVEGIENPGILKMVEEYEPDCLQGYFYSCPCDPLTFETIFLEEKEQE